MCGLVCMKTLETGENNYHRSPSLHRFQTRGKRTTTNALLLNELGWNYEKPNKQNKENEDKSIRKQECI